MLISRSNQKLVKLAACGNITQLITYALQQNKEAESGIVEKEFLKYVTKEAKTLCSQPESSFKCSNIRSLDDFSYKKQNDELQTKAPHIYNTILAIAINKQALKCNKVKKSEILIPSIMNSVNSLLMCRNQFFNQCAVINSLVLKRGKCDKMCFRRFQALNQCLSYPNILKKQTELGQNFKSPVLAWANEINIYKDCLMQDLDSIRSKTDKDIGIELQERAALNVSNDILDNSFLDEAAKHPVTELISLENLNENIKFTVESNCQHLYPELEDSLDIEFDDGQPNNGSGEENTNNYVPKFYSKAADSPHTMSISPDCTSLKPNDDTPKFMFVGDNLDLKIHRRRTQQKLDRT